MVIDRISRAPIEAASRKGECFLRVSIAPRKDQTKDESAEWA
jgi:hypothetical protein